MHVQHKLNTVYFTQYMASENCDLPLLAITLNILINWGGLSL